MTNLSYINRNWLEQEARKSFENHFPQYVGTADYGKYFDAYRHTYVSALLTREFGSTIADMMGIINEILGVSNTMPDHNQDLWNNRVGRELVGNSTNLTDAQIADLVANAMNNGDCITDKNNDPRINDIVPEYPISEAIFTVEGFVKNLLSDLLEDTQTISSDLQSSYNKFLASVNTTFVHIKDPLIIDGGNDGLELNSLETSRVLFDLDGDGNSESTGWVKSSSEGGDELFLALDKNQNGNIDSIEELFGNDTTGGFAELSVYDSNQDNIINSSDSQFNLLKIWNDANANGIVDSGEINSLTNHNITSISLNTSNYITTINGNNVTAVANVNFTDGSVKKIYEVWFGSNEFNSAIANPDVALGSDFELNLEVLTQAFSRGYGELSSWQIAMSNNTDLLNLSKQINNLTPNQFNQIDDLFSQFLFKWADVEDATNASVYNGAETGFDPRKMAFLEKITGLDFNYTTQNAIPLAVTAWNSFYNNLLNRFLIQGTLNEIFPNAHYDFTTDTLTLNNTLDEVITNILSLSNQMDESSFLNYAYYAQNILQLNRDQFNDVDFDAKVNAAITSIINSASVEGFAFNGVFNIGDVGNNSLFGGTGNDVLKGLEGNDVIFGDNGNDYIEGGKGADQLKGGGGNDIYKFNLGDGIDVIEDGAGTDKIIFGEGVTLAHITLARVGNDLLITIGSDGDQIGIKNFYSATVNRIESIIFDDGTQFSLGNLGNIVVGSDNAETITGTSADDIISAAGGNDTVNASSGNDTVSGGQGNDIFNDGSGNDTYIFNIGDGQDTINDSSGTDKIIFGDGILQSDITLIPNNSNLIIKIGNNGDQIAINGFFSSGFKIETLQFADGTTINLAEGLTLNGTNPSGETINATSFDDIINGNIGNDTINASSGNDIINGGDGNDTIKSSLGNDIITGGKGNDNIDDSSFSGSGNDTYIFNIGDGVDTIRDTDGTDKIIFGEGILQTDITLIPNNSNLIIKIGNNGDQIAINGFFSEGYKIETLQFADGSTFNISQGLTLNGTNPSGETINATSFDDIINGNIGNDTINASSGNDIINGGDGNDTIKSSLGNDIITGGKGNDNIDDSSFSGSGNDTYIFNIGDGVDTIRDTDGTDKIIFGEGILQTDITLIPNNSNLIIKIGNNGDQIAINGFFSEGYKIETLQFADGSTFNISQGLTLNGTNPSGETINATSFDDIINGNIGNDTINASSGNDIVNGGDGNDTINSNLGDDIITGGKGNDIITDSLGSNFAGNDTYIFNIGDGADTIRDISGTDKIIFGEEITQSDITLIPNNSNLIIKVGNNGDQIAINGFFSSGFKIETLQFADGTTINLAEGLTLNGTNPSGETINATSFDDIINGNIGNDTINASSGNDIINGGDGNDTIKSSLGNDIITGGKGNDNIDDSSFSGSGNDTYIFNIGDGVDTIRDTDGTDKIIFGEGILQTDITLIPNNSNLIIKIGNNGDQIAINGFFSEGYKIETLQFADGSTFNISQGLTLNGTNPSGETINATSFDDIINGNIGNDTINASSGNDIINGGDGNDTIKSSLGNDIITGGKGNDNIDDSSFSGSGNDTYIFNIGDGVDTIRDTDGTDKIIFGEGITQGNIFIEGVGSNLIIRVGSNGDQITINSFFTNSNFKIETLQFADGSTMNISQGLILNITNVNGETVNGTSFGDIINGNIGNDTINAGDGNDILNGGDGNDTISAGNGNDVITGGKGNDIINNNFSDNGHDTYVFNIGDGADTITDFTGTDKIIFGEGILQSDITLIPNNQNLIVKVGNNGDQITISSFFSNPNNKIETLQFVDGSTIDLSLGLTLNGTNINGETINATSFDDTINGNIGNDTISGGNGNDVINGGDGNDAISAGNGNDTIIGGKGNDIIDNNNSDNGHDSYIFNIGDGADTITDFTGADKIIFGEGIVQSDVLMEANSSNLIIRVGNNGDQITINSFFTNNNFKIETLQFADGSAFNISDGINVSGSALNDNIIGTPFNDVLSGGDGNDYLYGSDGNDVLEGGNGSDNLRGGRNDDIYKFGSDFTNQSNNDNDRISEEGGVDTILFAAGISRDSISMISNGNDLIISGQNTPNIITISGFFSSSNNKVEFIEFNDGFRFNIDDISLDSSSDGASYYVGNNAAVYEDQLAKIRFFSDDGNIINNSNIVSVSNPANGVAEVIENGYITYVSNNNYHGNDNFIITYLDDESNIQTKTVNIEVLSVNDSPVAQNINVQINEDNAIEISALDNANDVDGDSLFINNVGNFTHGSAVIVDNKIIYTPNENFYGQDSFTYQVGDGNGGFDTKTITVDVAPINDQPITQNDAANTLEGNGVLIDITNNDSDAEDGFFDGNSINIIQQPEHGTVEITVDGKLFYIPQEDYYGTDIIRYSITDSEGLESNVAEVSIDIAFVNDAPKLTVNSQFIFNEDEAENINPADYFYDPENDDFSVIGATAENGTITIIDDQITYLSNGNFNGIDNLSFTLEDQHGNTRIVSTTAQVHAINDTPQAFDDSFELQEDNSIRMGVLNNDSDVDDVLFSNNFSNISNPLNGSVVINQDGTINYTPNANFYGSDSFTYEVTDSAGLTSQATVSIIVNSVNDTPQVNITSANVNENNIVIIDVLASASDADGDDLIIDSFTNPINGSVQIVENKLVYTPNSNYFGTDSFDYTISDGNGGLTTKTIAVEVALINDAPVINAAISNQSAKAGNPFSITIPESSFSDIDGDILEYSAGISDGNGGILALPLWLSFDSNTRTLTGTPPHNNAINLILSVIASDGEFSVSQDFDLTISNNAVNGSSTNDTLIGTINNDFIFGESGSDLLSGGAGNDILNYSNDKNWNTEFFARNIGSPDAVDLNGQRVTIAPRIGNADGFDGGEGIDTIQMSDANEAIFLDDRYTSNPFGYNTARIRDIEVINAGGGDDIIDLTSKQFAYSDITLNGDNGNDVLWSSSGNDIINGGNGNDNIDGGTGNDILNGDDGNDTIYGKGGNDIITGGFGQDTLFGGSGNDIFKFSTYQDSRINASDLIKDFTQGQDKINLTDLNLIDNIVEFDSNPNDAPNEGISYYYDTQNNTVIQHNDIANDNNDFVVKIQGRIELNNGDFEF